MTIDLTALVTNQTQQPGDEHCVLNSANFDTSRTLALEMNYSVQDGTDVAVQCGVCVLWQRK